MRSPEPAPRLLVLAIVWAVCASVLCGTALAHEFWIEPNSHRIEAGRQLLVSLKVGDRFTGEAYPRNPQHIERFFLVGPGETQSEVPGAIGADPAGTVRLSDEGTYLVAYRSRQSRIELEPAKFEQYLAEEGLEQVIEARKNLNQSAAPGRELFSRCAKALISVGQTVATGFDRRLGLTLELIPGADPRNLPADRTLPVQLLYQGTPLAQARITARNASDKDGITRARTDAEGRAQLTLGSGGRWLIAAVHMVPARDRSAADWESIWTSLTFETADPRP